MSLNASSTLVGRYGLVLDLALRCYFDVRRVGVGRYGLAKAEHHADRVGINRRFIADSSRNDEAAT